MWPFGFLLCCVCSNSKDGNKCHGNCTYLQKSLPGGVMLIELAFRDVYFCVTVYAFESSSVPVGKTVNPQVRLGWNVLAINSTVSLPDRIGIKGIMLIEACHNNNN